MSVRSCSNSSRARTSPSGGGYGADGTPSLKGALVRGEERRPFNYGFTNVRTEAEKLARNLRKLADQMKPATK